MHTNTRKLDERSPQRLSSMKSAKETQSPIHSNRTHEELENRMSSNSVSNILGLNVEGTLMRMDDQGLCHIVIAHNDPLYSEKVMKRLTRLHIEGQTLQWEGEIISLDSIRLTQRAHPSNMKELQVDDHFEFPPLSSSNNNALKPPSMQEPEIEIDNGEPKGDLYGESVEIDIDVSATYIRSNNFHLTTYGNYFIKLCKSE